MTDENLPAPDGYTEFLTALQSRIEKARVRAGVAVNRELVLLYWQTGRDILRKQETEGWGAKVIDRLAADLRRALPGMRGFSARNLKYMRSLASAWTEEEIGQAPLAQITWYQNITLIEKVKSRERRLWYAQQAVENGWSRPVLVHQIDTDLYGRQGQALTNFERTLPTPQSELAHEVLKDPYSFEFLTIAQDAKERELQKALLERLRDFLLELGTGFAFVGSDVHLEVGGDDFYLDLLFYHLRLRAYVVVELKTVDFKPEFAGKMSFYLSAVDDLLRHDEDRPSIGLILCRGKNRTVVEYTLRDTAKPIGVSEHRTLPEGLRGNLPTVEQLEQQLSGNDESS